MWLYILLIVCIILLLLGHEKFKPVTEQQQVEVKNGYQDLAAKSESFVEYLKSLDTLPPNAEARTVDFWLKYSKVQLL